MTIDTLSPQTQSVIRRVLAFVATTPELDGDFEIRLGVERAGVTAALMRWPAVDDRADDAPATLAINNALNEVVNGLLLSAEDWLRLGTTRYEVESAIAEWAMRRGWPSPGRR
jgi:hypothetical protein